MVIGGEGVADGALLLSAFEQRDQGNSIEIYSGIGSSADGLKLLNSSYNYSAIRFLKGRRGKQYVRG